MFNRRVFSRRSLLTGTTASLATAGLGTLDTTFTTMDAMAKFSVTTLSAIARIATGACSIVPTIQ